MPTSRSLQKPSRLTASLAVVAAALAACSFPAYETAQEPLGHCENALFDSALGETDFDCGGGCAACALGRHCASFADCAEGTCTQGVCTLPDPGNEPTTPLEPTEPTEPTTPTEPTEPTMPTEPTEPTTPTEPTEPTPEPERSLTVAATSAHGMSAWDGTNQSGSVVRVDHTLSYARGSNRLLLLGISSFGTGAGPFTARYDDVPMQLAVELEHPARQAYAAVYYLLDDQLPAAAGTKSRAEVTFNPKAWWGLGGFTVLELQNASQQKPRFNATSAADSCNAASTRGVRLEFTSPGALVFAVLSTHGSAKPPSLLSAPPLTEAWAEHSSNGNGHQTGSAAWVLDDDARAIDWATPGCWNSAAVGVVIERAPTDGT